MIKYTFTGRWAYYFIGFYLVAIGGWIANIVKLIGMIGGEFNAQFALRVAGVFFAPLGAVLGFA